MSVLGESFTSYNYYSKEEKYQYLLGIIEKRLLRQQGYIIIYSCGGKKIRIVEKS